MDYSFYDMCKAGDLEKVQLFVKTSEVDNETLNKSLYVACLIRHLDIFKFLMTSNDIKIKPDVNYNNGLILVYAIQSESFDIIKYLLSSSDVNPPYLIHKKNSYFLGKAAQYGEVDMLDYLLCSNDFKHGKLFQKWINYAYCMACENGQIEIIKYLFEHKKFNKLVHPKRNENSGFCFAFKESQHSVLKYLLIENKDIYPNEEINNLQDDVRKIILEPEIEKETCQYFETLLSIRKLDLENKLTIKYNNFQNKIKI